MPQTNENESRRLTSFSDFALGEFILRAVANEGHSAPTPIQAQSISPILAGRDLCGIAQTGTGKTAAFALPILRGLSERSTKRMPLSPRVLVLTPTRELATQVAQSFRTYGAGLRLSTAVVFGGVSQRPQVDALRRGVDILVATPGRLLDLVEQKALMLGRIEVLVVDEADQMLDLGFIVPLKRIVKLVPDRRQTLFFSATMPKTIADLAGSLLTDPVHVAVAPVATTVESVDQSVMFVASAAKQAALERILADSAVQRVLVFTRTKHGADKVVRNLDRGGIDAAAIHGNKSQPQRERALAAFKKGTTRVLVATDIAARGIHIEGVTHVINFDLPNVPESYVHRIGRTARAGAAGIAISFCNSEERAYLRDIEKLTRMAVPVAATPAGLEGAAEAPDSSRAGRKRGASRPAPHKQQAKPGRSKRGRRGGSEKGGQDQSRGERVKRSPGGLDSSTGLPAFLLQRRERRQDRDSGARA
jgi:ATP-dependent RNA helicase RhlE